jgi:hypothetical protein
VGDQRAQVAVIIAPELSDEVGNAEPAPARAFSAGDFQHAHPVPLHVAQRDHGFHRSIAPPRITPV